MSNFFIFECRALMQYVFEWDPQKARLNVSKANTWSNEMKKEYDFAKGERGKFYNADAKFNLPIYLDDDNFLFVEALAKRKDSDVSTVVNELIRSDRQNAKVIE